MMTNDDHIIAFFTRDSLIATRLPCASTGSCVLSHDLCKADTIHLHRSFVEMRWKSSSKRGAQYGCNGKHAGPAPPVQVFEASAQDDAASPRSSAAEEKS
eukprot:3593936-Amphidinium_carterae.1